MTWVLIGHGDMIALICVLADERGLLINQFIFISSLFLLHRHFYVTGIYKLGYVPSRLKVFW